MTEKSRPNNVKGSWRSPEAARVDLENLERNDSAILKYMNSVDAPVGVLQLLKNVGGIRKVESFCFSDETKAKVLELASSPEIDHQSDITDKAFAIQASLERLLVKDQIVIQEASGTHLYAVTHAGAQNTTEINTKELSYTHRT